MTEVKAISFKVYRYNPQVDAHPYHDTFDIPVEKGITVLRALDYIKQNLEPRLSFRSFCHAGICGSCAMKINGVTKLACTTQVWDELKNCLEDNVISIEPIVGFESLKDLVVDMDPMVEKLENYTGWIETTMDESEMGKAEFKISPEEFKLYDSATDCIFCASCVSECPLIPYDKDYVSPAIILRSYRMNMDSRDSASQERIDKLADEHGIIDCRQCNRCSFVCVKKIPIVDAINHLKEKAVKQKNLGS
jgi:succinate dehydrogenase / fumarate reductase iron-sulfur subunit